VRFRAQRNGQAGKPLTGLIGAAAQMFFRIVAIVMWAAPIGAFGAIAFTVGKFGAGSLLSLGKLLISFYVTCLVFILAVLWPIAHFTGVSLFRFIRYIREELLIVIATTSSETVLPRMIAKLEAAGCDESVVGLVIPTGYSFNLDGTCLYLATAAVFLAQATNTGPTAHAAARAACGAAARLQGRSRRRRCRLHRAGGDFGRGRHDSGRERGDHSRRASVDVAGADADQSDRQWHRNARHRPLGAVAGRRAIAGGARQAARMNIGLQISDGASSFVVVKRR
jgi:sodium:dicarboxylate symporter family protein